MPDVIERGAMAFAFSVYRADSPRGAETAETVWRRMIDEADRANFRRDIRAALQAALDPTDEELVERCARRMRKKFTGVRIENLRMYARATIEALSPESPVPNESPPSGECAAPK